MSRNTFIFLGLLTLLAAGIFWYQYQFQRTPVSPPDNQTRTIVLGASHPDDIPSIDEPTFESIVAADMYLHDRGYGIAVTVGQSVRFYPFQILVWHEVVNDTLNGRDILVTHDPLTFTSAVYDRADRFGVSGKIWNSNTLLYDETTQSLWSQLRGEAIDGSLTGTTLQRYPSLVMTWADFKKAYAYGQVLSRETGFDRDYTQDPYGGYAGSQSIWFALDHEDARLPSKSLVFGVSTPETAIAFPVNRIEEFVDIQSIVSGDAVPVASYWFAWSAMYPDTQIYAPTP